MAKLVFGNGKDRIEMSADLQKSFLTLANAAAPSVVRTMEEHIDAGLEAVKSKWPVSKRRRTPSKPTHSIDHLESRIVVAADSISSEIASGAGYTKYIKSYQHGLEGKSAWVELVRKPGLGEAIKLGSELSEQIIELAGDAFK